jgi:5-methylcytosine-specific restriction endonuclease McrA
MASRPIVQINHKWEFIEAFPSIAAAIKNTGSTRYTITQILDKKGNFDATEQFLWLDRNIYDELCKVNEINTTDKPLSQFSYVITPAMLHNAMSTVNLYIRTTNASEWMIDNTEESREESSKNTLEFYIRCHSVPNSSLLPSWDIDDFVTLCKEYSHDGSHPIVYLLRQFSKYGTYKLVTTSNKLDTALTPASRQLIISALDNINSIHNIYDVELFKKRFMREDLAINDSITLNSQNTQSDSIPDEIIKIAPCEKPINPPNANSQNLLSLPLQELDVLTSTMVQSTSPPSINSSDTSNISMATIPELCSLAPTMVESITRQNASCPNSNINQYISLSQEVSTIEKSLIAKQKKDNNKFDIKDDLNLFLHEFRSVESKIRHYDYELNPITQKSFEELEVSIIQLRIRARKIREKNGDLTRYLTDISRFVDRVHFIGRELEHQKNFRPQVSEEEKSTNELNTSLENLCLASDKKNSPSRLLRARKQHLSQDLREQVWNLHIGDQYNKVWCPYCGERVISPFGFQCGHVKAESKGGQATVDNLRPICGTCNQRMRTSDLDLSRYKLRVLKEGILNEMPTNTDQVENTPMI